MARPRKIVRAAERARRLHGQLSAAYRVLAELRGCLEKLASIDIDPVYAQLGELRKYTEYGDYSYPVLQLCPPGSRWYGDCEQVYVTRFRGFAEALVEADRVSRLLAELAERARWTLQALDELEGLLKRLDEETRRVEEYAKHTPKPKPREEEVAAVG